ncbi:MAG: glycosyltransferase [Alphaproteobacteria bacterium]|nr:glycosyltransferase [Alphaproteobacteria bacterium]
MNSLPLITVAVNYYNDKEFLPACIESILNQTYKNFELVLFNHASTDGSRDIARSYNDSRIIHIDAEKNLGAGAMYNFKYILPVIKGDYYKGFCADDVMKSDCLTNLVEYAAENPDKDLIFGNLEYINAAGKKLGQDWFHSVKNFSIAADEIDLLKMFADGKNSLPCPGAMIKANLLRKITLDQSLTIRADMWLWVSMLLQGAKVGYCDKIVGAYRFHDYQESSFDLEIVRQRSEYEKSPFLSLFFGIKSIETAKAVFPDSPYADQLTDTQDIPFYVAEYFLRKEGYPFAYDALFKMMLDDETRDRLERVFGFGVLELRKLYAFRKGKASFKKRVYAKQPQKLTLIELLYLLSKKSLKALISLISLRFLRHRNN